MQTHTEAGLCTSNGGQDESHAHCRLQDDLAANCGAFQAFHMSILPEKLFNLYVGKVGN